MIHYFEQWENLQADGADAFGDAFVSLRTQGLNEPQGGFVLAMQRTIRFLFAGDCVAATDQGLIETFFGERDKLATVGNVIVRAAGNSTACRSVSSFRRGW